MTIKESLKNNKTIFSNVASLGLLQIANYVIPIAVIPFVVRALGVDMIGRVSYAQNIVAYFTLFVLYGFEYSATREIAINRENKNKLSKIFWSIIIDRIFLLIISFFLFYIVINVWEECNKSLYLAVFLINVGFTFFPTWFFQGMEEMGKMAVFNFLIKVFGMGLTIFFVTSPSDYMIFATLPSLSYAIVGILSFLYVIKKYKIKKEFTNLIEESSIQLKKGFSIFLNTLFTSINTYANVTILGLYANDYEVGIYSGAQKIIMAILMITSMPINISIFPAISRKVVESKVAGIKTFKTYIKYVLLISFIVSFITFLCSPLLVKILLGESFNDSIYILKILSPLPLLVIMASMLTVQGVYGFGLHKFAPIIGLSLALFSIVLNFALIPNIGVIGASTTWICAEILEIIISSTIFYIYVVRDKSNNKLL